MGISWYLPFFTRMVPFIFFYYNPILKRVIECNSLTKITLFFFHLSDRKFLFEVAKWHLMNKCKCQCFSEFWNIQRLCIHIDKKINIMIIKYNLLFQDRMCRNPWEYSNYFFYWQHSMLYVQHLFLWHLLLILKRSLSKNVVTVKWLLQENLAFSRFNNY